MFTHLHSGEFHSPHYGPVPSLRTIGIGAGAATLAFGIVAGIGAAVLHARRSEPPAQKPVVTEYQPGVTPINPPCGLDCFARMR